MLAALRPVAVSWILLTALCAQDIVGTWSGALDVGVARLRLVLHVAGEPGALTATLDSPDQGAEGIPVDEITFVGGALEFSIRNLRAEYEGRLDEETGKIVGTFTQGRAFALELARGEVAGPRRPQHPEPPFPYEVEQVYYSHDPAADTAKSFRVSAADVDEPEGRVRLAATLTLPKGEGPHPAAVLISGSGAQDRDESLLGHKPFLVLADALTRRGIAVLRFDDRGTAESTGDHATATTRDFAQDAHAGVLYLRTRAEIAADEIGLIGHSEGGLIAPIVASGAGGGDVAFVVMLAGPGVRGDEIILLQSRLIGAAMGGDEEVLEYGERTNREIFAAVRDGGEPEALRARLEALLGQAYDEMPETARADAGPRAEFVEQGVARLTTPWFRFFLSYDPVPALRELRCPVLALNGEKDLQVDPDQNLEPIRAALADNPDATVVELPGLNHLFQRCETGAPSEYAEIEQTFDPAALQRVAGWIAQRFL